jgi:hypothetical protein
VADARGVGYFFETDDGFEGWMHHPTCGAHDVVAVVTHACGKVWATRIRSDEHVANDRRGEDWCARVVAEARKALNR